MKKICFLILLFFLTAKSQTPFPTPLEKSGFTKLSDGNELVEYLQELQKAYPVFQLDVSNKTSEGRIIPVVSFGAKPGKADKRLGVLFFAQQHGDEPSGKEGLLMLIRDLAQHGNTALLKNMRITIIPQVNPDGGAVCRRRNANKMDLNRNHLILTEIESSLIHRLYQNELPELTIDFHEYSPYSESWTAYGALKNFNEQIGTLTNPNIPAAIREYQKEKVLPAIIKDLTTAGFTAHEYLVGGPPEVDRLRYSTAHANDGRQSLGSYGSLSFIVEGLNGRDCIDNIGRRAKGQYTAAKSMLGYALANLDEIKALVQQTRKEIAAPSYGKTMGTVFEHVANGEKLPLTLLSVATNKDTTVLVQEWHPVTKSLHDVTMPLGYLIPKSDEKLIAVLKKHNMPLVPYKALKKEQIVQYTINRIDTLTVEEDPFAKPELTAKTVQPDPAKYLYVPMNGIHQRYAVLALEPVSLYGLHQYEAFKYMLETPLYPVLRVEKVQ